MEIIIGRDDNTLQWHFKADKTEQSLGQPRCVSPSVSRVHCRLTIDDQTALMTLTNLNPANVTRVNGMAIESSWASTGHVSTGTSSDSSTEKCYRTVRRKPTYAICNTCGSSTMPRR